MNRIFLGLTIIAVLHHANALAVVREITVDERSMAEIYLTMGRSTVLHFSEKPTKIIAGNQNYFNIEFTGQDVTIQPLGPVVSNLFVYGEYRRYGFILKVSYGGRYDDLVRVRWKGNRFLSPKPPELKVLEEKKRAHSKVADLLVTKVIHDPNRKLHIVELEIKDKTGTRLEAKNITVTAHQSQKELKINEVVFNKDFAPLQDPVLKARIFLKVREKSPVALSVIVKGKRTTLSLPERLFQ